MSFPLLLLWLANNKHSVQRSSKQISGGNVVDFWWKCSGILVEPWWIFGGNMVDLQSEWGGILVETWLKCGGYLVEIWAKHPRGENHVNQLAFSTKFPPDIHQQYPRGFHVISTSVCPLGRHTCTLTHCEIVLTV